MSVPTLKEANGGRSQVDVLAEFDRWARVAIAASLDRDIMGLARRLGRYSASTELIGSMPWAGLVRIFSGIRVVRAEGRGDGGGIIDYLGESGHFETLGENEEIPTYEATIHTEDGGETVSRVEWSRSP